MRPKLAVVGPGVAERDVMELAREIGRLAVETGFRVITGGLGGVMEAASRGAHEAANYREGDTIGILPGTRAVEANRWVDIVLPTGLGISRNVVVVSTADVVVAVGGRSGTLSEIALAWQLGRPIVALDAVEGWAATLGGSSLDDRVRGQIQRVSTASEAVHAAIQVIEGTY